MNDELSTAEQHLADQLRTLAIRGTSHRDAATVADAARAQRLAWWRRRPQRLRLPVVALAAVVMLAVSVTAVGLLTTQQDASRLASARVRDLDYTLSVARSFDAPADALVPFADEVTVDPVFDFDGLVAYSIRGVDPSQVLVMRLAPDQRDDAGPLGRYVLLVRGPDAFSLVCAYFDPRSEATPRACRGS